MIQLTSTSAAELDIFTPHNENQLLHYYEPEPGIFIAESPLVIGRALDAGYVPAALLCDSTSPDPGDADIIARCADIPVFTGNTEEIVNLTGFRLIRGALCAMKRRRVPEPEEVCAGASRIAVLENVVNPTNIGAIFRSAAALGMDAVMLTSGCSDPLYRRSSRVSMGTVFQVPYSFVTGGIPQLRELGFSTAAMALSDKSISIDSPLLKNAEKLAVVLGTEGEGLTPGTISACDYTVKIPMYHGVDSLNVAAASAVAFWELRRR